MTSNGKTRENKDLYTNLTYWTDPDRYTLLSFGWPREMRGDEVLSDRTRPEFREPKTIVNLYLLPSNGVDQLQILSFLVRPRLSVTDDARVIDAND